MPRNGRKSGVGHPSRIVTQSHSPLVHSVRKQHYSSVWKDFMCQLRGVSGSLPPTVANRVRYAKPKTLSDEVDVQVAI